MRSAELISYDGWHAWRVIRLGGTKLHELRLPYGADSDRESAAPWRGEPGPQGT